MNILYIADPNSIHDLKWISAFTRKWSVHAFILPRAIHTLVSSLELPKEHVTVGKPIRDFSIFRFHITIATALRIKRIIKRSNIDVVHILYAEPNALWCLFRNYFGVPVIISSRGTDVLRTIPQAFKKRDFINRVVSSLYRMAFSMADFVTGTSRSQLNSIRNFSGRSDGLFLVRTGVDIQRLQKDTSTHFPLQTNTPFVLFPRYIRRLYNHEFCLKAITLLSREIKSQYKMVFVGRDHYEADLAYQEFLIQEMKLVKEVDFIFLPEVTQESIFELYKRASLVVMTPLSDGSPVSAMEAIACGAKVILGPLNYDEEIYKDWTYKLNSWDAKELSDLMVRCLMSKEKVDPKNFIPLIDRENEMNKMGAIYRESVARYSTLAYSGARP